MVDSAGVSNLGGGPAADPLTLALPQISGLAATIHKLVQEGLTVDEAAQKLAVFVAPQMVPALKTLASVLSAVEKFLPGAVGTTSEHGGE